MIAMVIRKNQKIRKSSLLHSLYLSQCLEKMSLCNLKIFLCISIEKWKPRIIPRSRPSASTSKRTLASIFQSWYTRKFSNYTWTIFPNTSSRQCVKERTIPRFKGSFTIYVYNLKWVGCLWNVNHCKNWVGGWSDYCKHLQFK